MKSTLLITHFDQKYGYGHYKRSLRLYKFLKKFTKIKFITSENKKIYKNFNNLIFDLPSYKNFLKGYLKKDSQKIIALDYKGRKKIDVNFAISQRSKYAKKNYISLKNTIVPKKKKTYNKNYILITLGGYDRKKQSLKIAYKLFDIYKCKVIVVMGPLNIIKYKSVNNKILILSNPHNFKKLQENCKFAITNGGLTLKEMLNLQKSVYAIPQTKDEKKLCHKLSNYFNFKFGSPSQIQIVRFRKKLTLKFDGLKEFKKII